MGDLERKKQTVISNAAQIATQAAQQRAAKGADKAKAEVGARSAGSGQSTAATKSNWAGLAGSPAMASLMSNKQEGGGPGKASPWWAEKVSPEELMKSLQDPFGGLAAKRAAAKGGLAGKHKLYVPLPMTRTYRIFRNGDPTDKGAELFLKAPPRTLRELLDEVGKVRRPIVGKNVLALYDQWIRPLTALDELGPSGSAYLAKGPEPMEPSALFLGFRFEGEGPAPGHPEDTPEDEPIVVGRFPSRARFGARDFAHHHHHHHNEPASHRRASSAAAAPLASLHDSDIQEPRPSSRCMPRSLMAAHAHTAPGHRPMGHSPSKMGHSPSGNAWARSMAHLSSMNKTLSAVKGLGSAAQLLAHGSGAHMHGHHKSDPHHKPEAGGISFKVPALL